MSILGISRYFSTKNKREKWEWRGHQDEEKKMETKETNWWGNDTNEGSRFDVSIIHDWFVKIFRLING